MVPLPRNIPVYVAVGQTKTWVELGTLKQEKLAATKDESDLLMAKFLQDQAKAIVADMEDPHCLDCFWSLSRLAHDSCRSVE